MFFVSFLIIESINLNPEQFNTIRMKFIRKKENVSSECWVCTKKKCLKKREEIGNIWYKDTFECPWKIPTDGYNFDACLSFILVHGKSIFWLAASDFFNKTFLKICSKHSKTSHTHRIDCFGECVVRLLIIAV